jgi:mono/diheme cytochrome c family protein
VRQGEATRIGTVYALASWYSDGLDPVNCAASVGVVDFYPEETQNVNPPDPILALHRFRNLACSAVAVLALGVSFGACAASTGPAALSRPVALLAADEQILEAELHSRFDALASRGRMLFAADDKRGGMQSSATADAEKPAAGAAKPVADGKTDAPAGAAKSAETKADPNFDVQQLFAGTCGWCHSNGGRDAGKGPQLMDSKLTDAEIIYRIKNGKPGYMPAFGSAYNDNQIRSIIEYIRNLKPAKS